MIERDHLVHWLDEIKYALNGINTHLQKDGFKEMDGTMVNGSHLSFDYLREKGTTIDRLLGCILNDMLHDTDAIADKAHKWEILSGLFPDLDWKSIEYIAIKVMGDELKTHVVTEHLGKGDKDV